MDAKKLGAFIAECRKAKGWTQAELAAQLHVTDKAVSRWERGVGFPDIATLEPLAEALGVSILELMRAQRLGGGGVAEQEAAAAVSDTLQVANLQRGRALQRLLQLLGAAYLLIMGMLLWEFDFWLSPLAKLVFGSGLVLPVWGVEAILLLLGYALYRGACGKRCRGAFIALAAALPGLCLAAAVYTCLWGSTRM